ncbi:MAG: hypothetical protein QM501_01965 [Gimesia sp.]
MNPQDELDALVKLFPHEQQLFERAEHVSSSAIPDPYKSLLAHNHHMTVTMEDYHDSSVDVSVLNQRLDENVYSRVILLSKTGTDDVVQFGIVRFNFDYVTQDVKDEILAGEIPLGRVLINHNVLRHVDLGAVLRITAGPGLAKVMKIEPGEVTYGRLATIFCNQQPAIDLLEISARLQ